MRSSGCAAAARKTRADPNTSTINRRELISFAWVLSTALHSLRTARGAQQECDEASLGSGAHNALGYIEISAENGSLGEPFRRGAKPTIRVEPAREETMFGGTIGRAGSGCEHSRYFRG